MQVGKPMKPANFAESMPSVTKSTMAPVGAQATSSGEAKTYEVKDYDEIDFFATFGQCEIPSFNDTSIIGYTSLLNKIRWRTPKNGSYEYKPDQKEIIRETSSAGLTKEVPPYLGSTSRRQGTPEKVSMKDLLPCEDNRNPCDTPLHGLAYSNVPLKSFNSTDSGTISQALEKAIKEAKAKALRRAGSINCPSGHPYCPTNVLGRITWIMHFVLVKSKAQSGRGYDGYAVSLAQHSARCIFDPTKDKLPGPVIEVPPVDTPTPPDRGGGTPTPPGDSGRGTPTPR
jgi:hypothetical protein